MAEEARAEGCSWWTGAPRLRGRSFEAWGFVDHRSCPLPVSTPRWWAGVNRRGDQHFQPWRNPCAGVVPQGLVDGDCRQAALLELDPELGKAVIRSDVPQGVLPGWGGQWPGRRSLTTREEGDDEG